MDPHEPCMSCGVQHIHHLGGACPRFVSRVFQSSRRAGKYDELEKIIKAIDFKIGIGSISEMLKGGPSDLEAAILSMKTSLRDELIYESNRFSSTVLARINALEKQLAKAQSMAVQRYRDKSDPIDWTKVISDEDLLEEGYNGFPKPKKRIIF